MKKGVIATAIMASVAAWAGTDMKTGTFATTATRTVYTNTVNVGAWGLGPVVGGFTQPRELCKVIVKNNTATNASVAIAMEDIADWTTLTGSPVTAAAGTQAIAYPAREYTETMAGYITTNILTVVVDGETTNRYPMAVAVPVTTTVTKSTPYMVRTLRFITTLDATNAPSTVTWGVEYK